MNKETIKQALQELYNATTVASLPKQTHDSLLKKAQEILAYIESSEEKKEDKKK